MNNSFIKWFCKELVTVMLIFLTVLNTVLLIENVDTYEKYNNAFKEVILIQSETQESLDQLNKRLKETDKKIDEWNKKVKELEKKEAEQRLVGDNGDWKNMGDFYLTAYCDCSSCQEQWVGTTATGATPTPGDTIAVDPNVIPLGSKVKIDGKVYTAEDTGGAIKGKKIDILLENHAETEVWKNKYETVHVEI